MWRRGLGEFFVFFGGGAHTSRGKRNPGKLVVVVTDILVPELQQADIVGTCR